MPKENPSKLYYTISEVVKITGIKAHVLRYWESEFSTLRPKKTRAGNRRYRQKDIDEVLAIKELLHEQGYRIAGARKMRLAAHRQACEEVSAAPPQLTIQLSTLDPEKKLKVVKNELSEIMDLLKSLSPEPTREQKTKTSLREAQGKG